MCRLAETIFKAVSLAFCLPFLVVGALGFSLAAYWQVWPSAYGRAALLALC